ncbi:hypothetical protein [Pelagovum pacificum]|uniref:Nuclear transport factor 2 family protein n=1 Tax=Pelagovum pacificum TaxID=2588711 RepID=A0A5C5GK78_9RHOB|nr:hypothetical protein [Pelagovum pacificum]QQA42680.1 hypothetical protein I8N54_18195 [Pelagovum pacificum]TNY34169.1 hypothetical protein FHY64_13195 [Pelagovum pacificum]
MSITGIITRRPLRACAAAFVLLGLGATPALAQQDDLTIERSFAEALVRDLMTAINHGNVTGNYTVLRDYAAPSFGADNDPTEVAAALAPLRQTGIDLLQTLAIDPVILKAELGNENRELQLTGYFPLQPEHVSFDLLFRLEENRWWMSGMSVGTFEPIEDDAD